MKPIKPLTFDFISQVDHHTQVPMTARIIRPGEGYGLYSKEKNSYAKANVDRDGKPSKELLIEFYDTTRVDKTKQTNNVVPGFNVSRYALSTLLADYDQNKPVRGLQLDGREYKHQVDHESLYKVLKWADSHRKRLELPKDPDPLTFD